MELLLSAYIGLIIACQVTMILYIEQAETEDLKTIFPSLFNPFTIYQENRVNWFGCIMLTLLGHFMFPIMAICYWIYKIGQIFYKLCIIGRK